MIVNTQRKLRLRRYCKRTFSRLCVWRITKHQGQCGKGTIQVFGSSSCTKL